MHGTSLWWKRSHSRSTNSSRRGNLRLVAILIQAAAALLPLEAAAQAGNAQFLLIYIKERKVIDVDQIQSVTVLDPQYVQATVEDSSHLALLGVAMGQTYVFVWNAKGKAVLAVEVEYPRSSFAPTAIPVPQASPGASFGSYSTTVTQTANENGLTSPAVEQNAYFTAPMGSYTLTSAASILNSFGTQSPVAGGSQEPLQFREAYVRSESKRWGFTVLDANVDAGMTSLSNVTLRGLQVRWTRPRKSITAYSGIGRQSLAFIGTHPSFVAGTALSYRLGNDLNLRSSLSFLRRRTELFDRTKGVIANLGADYQPKKNLKLEGELGLSNTGSAQAVGLHYRRAHTEVEGRYTHFPRLYPLVFLQLLPGGQQTTYVNVLHNFSDHLQVSSFFSDGRVTSDTRFSSSLSRNRYATVAASYLPNAKNQLAASYTQISLDNLILRSTIGLTSRRDQSTNKSVQLTYSRQIFPLLTNSWQVSRNWNYDPTYVNRFQGWQLSDDIRKNFEHSNTNLSGRFSYSRQVPSLAQFVRLRPFLLPPSLSSDFITDPLFFVHNDALLRVLFPPSVITTERSIAAEAAVQHNTPRWGLSQAFNFFDQRTINSQLRFWNPAFSYQYRLRDLDVVQITENLQLDTGPTTTPVSRRWLNTIGISYTHYFGESARGTSLFSGLWRGRIEGEAYMDYNGNGKRDQGEPGIPNLVVLFNEKDAVRTDARGYFLSPPLAPGAYTVRVEGEAVGQTIRFLTTPEMVVELKRRGTAYVVFAATNAALLTGRVFNDFKGQGKSDAETPGVRDVVFTLRGMGVSHQSTASYDGLFQFPNLMPGEYTLELDSNSIPPDYNIPSELTRHVALTAQQALYLEQPLTAERTVSGVVYLDANGNGIFDAGDKPVPFADLEIDHLKFRADASGRFLMRGLKPGEFIISVRATYHANGITKELGRSLSISLPIEPVQLRNFDIAVSEQPREKKPIYRTSKP